MSSPWSKSGQTVKVPIGSTKLTVDGVQKDMLANNGTYKAAYINKSGRTLVHVRALQAFNNTTCTWNQSTKQVTVTYPTNTPTVTSKNYRVDLINKTGQDINALYYGQSGTYSYSQECADPPRSRRTAPRPSTSRSRTNATTRPV